MRDAQWFTVNGEEHGDRTRPVISPWGDAAIAAGMAVEKEVFDNPLRMPRRRGRRDDGATRSVR